MIDDNNMAVTQHKGMLNGVFQLPHVSGPRICRQLPDHIIGYALYLLVETMVELAAKVIDQQRNITDALTQRRKANLDNLEAIV